MNTSRGSVLMAVIWMIGIMSIFTIVISRRASQELQLGRWAMEHAVTWQLAKGGIDRALYEIRRDTFQTFDVFNESWASHPDFKQIPSNDGVTIIFCDPKYLPGAENAGASSSNESYYGACDEASRININIASETVLHNLLQVTVPGLKPEEISGLVDAILDWRDPDDETRLHGAESSYYRELPTPYSPRNGNFESVQELMMVKGVTRDIYDAVKPYVTVYTDGKVNFNTATSVALQALGLSSSLAERIILFRKGKDKIQGNKDDVIFQSVEGITPALSVGQAFSPEDFQLISNAIGQGWVAVKSDVFRIQSIGRLIRGSGLGSVTAGGNVETVVTCVVNRKGDVLYWQEGVF